jgi:benzodiazapine receptor
MVWNYILVGIILLISIFLTNYFSKFQGTFYKALKLPPYQPPPITFSVVWTILYIILWLTVSASYPKDPSILSYFILLNILLVGWTYVYFNLQSLWGAFFILLLTLIVGSVILKKMFALKQSQWIPISFSLFLIWILFASLLNLQSAIIN